MLQYFAKAGAHGVLTPGQLFNRVTGLSIMGEGAEFGVQVIGLCDGIRDECAVDSGWHAGVSGIVVDGNGC